MIEEDDEDLSTSDGRRKVLFNIYTDGGADHRSVRSLVERVFLAGVQSGMVNKSKEVYDAGFQDGRNSIINLDKNDCTKIV